MTHLNYPVGDFLIRVKNAGIAGRKSASARNTKLILEVSKALKKLGYIDGIEKEKGNITVNLTYKNKRPVLTNIKLVSKPGLRIYMSADELERNRKPFDYILTTSKGVMSSKDAIKGRIGGEVIVEIL